MLIVVANLKGGSGKSFVASLLALVLSRRRKPVAVIDLDSSTAATTRLLAGLDRVEPLDAGGGLLVGPIPVAGGRMDLYSAPTSLDWESRVFGKPQELVFEVAAIAKRYDVVIVDTPSAAYPATAAAMKAVARQGYVLVTPVARGPWTVVGAAMVAALAARLGAAPRAHVVVINNVYARELRRVRENVARAIHAIPWRVKVFEYIPRRAQLEDDTDSTYAIERFEITLRRYPEVMGKAEELVDLIEKIV